jgi:hypothetical protein
MLDHVKWNGRGHCTSRARSSSSTSETSHQLATRQSGPNKPGFMKRYDLNNAVSRIWANRNSCSGVSEDKGAFGNANKSSVEVSERLAI